MVELEILQSWKYRPTEIVYCYANASILWLRGKLTFDQICTSAAAWTCGVYGVGRLKWKRSDLTAQFTYKLLFRVSCHFRNILHTYRRLEALLVQIRVVHLARFFHRRIHRDMAFHHHLEAFLHRKTSLCEKKWIIHSPWLTTFAVSTRNGDQCCWFEVNPSPRDTNNETSQK